MRRFIHQALMTAALMVLHPDKRATYLKALKLGFDELERRGEL